MAFPKYKPPPSSPKNKLIVEKRIIDGIMRRVETYNGKVARVYDDDWKLLEERSGKLKVILPTPPLEPRARQARQEIKTEIITDDIPPQEDKPIEESPILDIPSFSIFPDDEVIKYEGTDTVQKDIPKEEKIEPPKIEEIPKVDTPKIEEIPKVDTPKIEEIPKVETPKIEEIPKVEIVTDSGISQQLDKAINIKDISNKLDKVINIKDISNKLDIPKIEITKEIPKKTSVPKTHEVPDVPIRKMENHIEKNRVEKLVDNKSTQTIATNDKININKVEDKIIQVTKAEKKPIEEKPIEDRISKENKNMVEELLEEYKREQWAKKRDFDKNIEDMARVASENKGQIKEISQQIEGVSGKVGEVEGKIEGKIEQKIGGLQENFQEKFGTLQEKFGTLQENLQKKFGDTKKPVSETLGELCTGVDCIKTDLKKSQEYQQSYQQSLEKELEGRFKDLSERLHKLEEPTFVCDNCGQDNIRPLSSFCPNCGAPIHSWTDPETGNPVSGWAPFWKRGQRYSNQE